MYRCYNSAECNIVVFDMGWMTWVQFLARAGIFLFVIMSRLAQGSTHPPIQWVLGALFPQ